MTWTKLDNEKLELHNKDNHMAQKVPCWCCCRKGPGSGRGSPTAGRRLSDRAPTDATEDRHPHGIPRQQRRLLPAQLPHKHLHPTHRRARAAAAADHPDCRQPHLEHQPPAPNRRLNRQQPTSAEHTRGRPNPDPPAPTRTNDRSDGHAPQRTPGGPRRAVSDACPTCACRAVKACPRRIRRQPPDACAQRTREPDKLCTL